MHHCTSTYLFYSRGHVKQKQSLFSSHDLLLIQKRHLLSWCGQVVFILQQGAKLNLSVFWTFKFARATMTGQDMNEIAALKLIHTFQLLLYWKPVDTPAAMINFYSFSCSRMSQADVNTLAQAPRQISEFAQMPCIAHGRASCGCSLWKGRKPSYESFYTAQPPFPTPSRRTMLILTSIEGHYYTQPRGGWPSHARKAL